MDRQGLLDAGHETTLGRAGGEIVLLRKFWSRSEGESLGRPKNLFMASNVTSNLAGDCVELGSGRDRRWEGRGNCSCREQGIYMSSRTDFLDLVFGKVTEYLRNRRSGRDLYLDCASSITLRAAILSR